MHPDGSRALRAGRTVFTRSAAPTTAWRRDRPMTPLDLLWLFFILSSLQPLVQQRILTRQRARALRALEKREGSRVITLINRREGFAFLGIPFGGFIDIEDSESVIRAVEMNRPRRADRACPAHAGRSGTRCRADRRRPGGTPARAPVY